jgi:hypothetical protein
MLIIRALQSYQLREPGNWFEPLDHFILVGMSLGGNAGGTSDGGGTSRRALALQELDYLRVLAVDARSVAQGSFGQLATTSQSVYQGT